MKELCKDCPAEFEEFMNYCKELSFTQDPDYKFMIDLFEGCMKKNDFDPKVPYFVWNQNRLAMEKQAMKE